MLNKAELDELKEKVEVKQLDLAEGKSLIDVYKIANRSNYETMLLFMKAYYLMKNEELLLEEVDKAREIGKEVFSSVECYPDYQDAGMESCLDSKFALVLEKNRELIYFFIDLVYGILFVAEKETDEDIFDKLEALEK